MRGVLLLGLIAGCYAPAIPSGAPCTSACPGEEVCIAGTCRTPGDLPALDGAIDVPDVDTDNDGPVDRLDNCPAVANLDQHDEDADALGDACDPCPHVASGGATDSDADGVGDVCDPQPLVAKQQWALFDPLVARRPGWTGDSIAFANDRMTLTGYTRLSLTTGEVRIVAGGTNAPGATMPRQIVMSLGENAAGAYYYAETYEQGMQITRFDGTAYDSLDYEALPALPAGPFTWTLDGSVRAQRITFALTVGGVTHTLTGATAMPALFVDNEILLGTRNTATTFDYIAVIRTLP